MMIFRHVFTSWLLANLFHPFLWSLWYMYQDHELVLSPGSGAALFLFSSVLSIPALLGAFFLLRFLLRSDLTTVACYVLWGFLVIVMLLAITAVLVFWFDPGFFGSGLLLTIPAVVAFVLAAAIRFPFFAILSLRFRSAIETPPDFAEFENLKKS